eukprot:3342038-Rhodomonas_salina.1
MLSAVGLTDAVRAGRDTFLTPRRIAKRVHAAASPPPGARGSLASKPLQPEESLLERRRAKPPT